MKKGFQSASFPPGRGFPELFSCTNQIRSAFYSKAQANRDRLLRMRVLTSGLGRKSGLSFPRKQRLCLKFLRTLIPGAVPVEALLTLDDAFEGSTSLIQ
jgi:hypothetical protein